MEGFWPSISVGLELSGLHVTKNGCKIIACFAFFLYWIKMAV